MKITIEGAAAQVRDACHRLTQALGVGRGRRLSEKRRLHQQHVVVRRQLFRRAFDLTRADPDDSSVTKRLAGILGGSTAPTQDSFNTACQICLDTGLPEDRNLVERATIAHRALI